MNKKTVKVDLSTFFSDERKMSCILVDPNWESIACLQKRIEILFDVDSVRFLSDGCFIPPQESIEILKYCNDIKAFVPKESLELRKKKRSDKFYNIQKSQESSNEFDQQHVDGTQKKRKNTSLEYNSTLSDAKRSKNSNSNVFLEINNKTQEVRKNGNNISKIKITSEVGGENQSAEVTESEENSIISMNSKDQYKICHVSTPKKSEMAINKDDRELDDKMSTGAEFASSKFLEESSHSLESRNKAHNSSNPSGKNPFKKLKSSGAHIYFNENGEIASPSNKITKSKSASKKDTEPKTIVIFRCPLRDVTNETEPQKPRVFHLVSKNVAKKPTVKQVVEIQEEIILQTILEQPVTEVLPLANEETDASQIEQKTNNETTTEKDKTDSLKEQSVLNNTIIPTENENNEKDCENDCKDSKENEEAKDTETKYETQSEHNSIMSVDCVDLSIDLNDDDIKVELNEGKNKKLKKDAYEKHDLTAEAENNDSSASDIEEISEIIDLNESEDICNISLNNSVQPKNPFKDILLDKILPLSTALTCLPNIDDIIIFKVAYLNEKNIPVNTNFMAGKVEYINKRTKCIKILVIDGVLELRHVPNKFICNTDDSQEYIKYLQLKLNDMKEAKLYSMP